MSDFRTVEDASQSLPVGSPSAGASNEQGRWSTAYPKSAATYWRRSILNDVVVMVEPFKVYMAGGHAWYNNGVLIIERKDYEWWSIPIPVPPNAYVLGSETLASEPKAQEDVPTIEKEAR